MVRGAGPTRVTQSPQKASSHILCIVHSKESREVLGNCVCFRRPSLLFPISERWEASTAKHIMEENKHTADGKHMWRRWNDLPRVNRMKYRLASCCGPIVALRSWCGGESADPRQTISLYIHKLPIWPFWSGFMRRPESDSDISIHCWILFVFPTCMDTHTLREPEAMGGGGALGHKKSLSPCCWVSVGFNVALWKD